MRLIDADKYCDFLNTYPLEKAQNNFMSFYREALQKTFEFEVEAIPIEQTKRMKNRLVDKAEVLEIFGELYDIFDDYKEIQKEIDKIYDKINDLPYIDVEEKAIPIEFIEAFKKEFRAVANGKAVIEWLLENWEKENETNRRR